MIWWKYGRKRDGTGSLEAKLKKNYCCHIAMQKQGREICKENKCVCALLNLAQATSTHQQLGRAREPKRDLCQNEERNMVTTLKLLQ